MEAPQKHKNKVYFIPAENTSHFTQSGIFIGFMPLQQFRMPPLK